MMKRQSSPHVTSEMAAQIKALINRGLHQHQIAAQLKINQGRVSEVNTGKLYPSVAPAKITQLDFFD